MNIVKTDLDIPGEEISIAPIVPVRYNKKWWFVGFSRYGKVVVVDIKGKTAQALTTDIGQVRGGRLVDMNFKGSKLYARMLGGDVDNNKVRLVEYEVDFSAMSASATELWALDTSDDSDMGAVVHKGTIIGNRFILHATANKPYIWYIDAKDGSIIDKYDTNLGTYNPRIDITKAVIKPDDIYILAGRHLSGDDFYIFKVFSKDYTKISDTAPDGESPLPKIGNALVGEKLHLIPVSGCTVVNTNPPIRWFDDDFNLLGSTSLSSITGYSYPHPTGWHIVGIDEDDDIIMLISIYNDEEGGTRKTKIMILKINHSTFSPTVLFSKEYSGRYHIGKAWYASRGTYALVDKDNKKVYDIACLREDHTENVALIEADISDVNIKEWNQQSYYTAYEKIPTVLTLNVTPL